MLAREFTIPAPNNIKPERVDELRLPLVDRFYADCKYRVKCGRQDRVYSLTTNGKIIAAARLIPQESGTYLLRNLCVAPPLRNQGVGKNMLRHVLEDLAPHNCYCYALPTLQIFYETLGFTHFFPEQVPPSIGDIHLRNCSRKRGWLLMGFINSHHK